MITWRSTSRGHARTVHRPADRLHQTILTDDEQDVMAFVREDDANRLLVI